VLLLSRSVTPTTPPDQAALVDGNHNRHAATTYPLTGWGFPTFALAILPSRSGAPPERDVF
jgi:hypothetical protein